MGKLIRSKKPKDRDELASYCFQFATYYTLEDTLWINFDELIQSTPLASIPSREQYLKSNKYVETNDQNFEYFLYINEYKIADQISPLEFVRDNIEYVSDPVAKEYIESPVELLQTRGGDCESGTLLLAALEESIGIDSEIVLIPGHAYLRIKLPSALNKYKLDGDWVYLDWTCNNCDFGEIPYKNVGRESSYLKV